MPLPSYSAWCCPHCYCPYALPCPWSSPCSHHTAGLLFILSLSQAQSPLQGFPASSPSFPRACRGQSLLIISAPSSDVTFSETQLPSWVTQPSLVTHTSHHHIFSAFFSFSTYHYLKKSFLFVYFWFSSNGSSLRSGSSSVLLTVVSAIPRSVFNKYQDQDHESSQHSNKLDITVIIFQMRKLQLREVKSSAQGHPIRSDVTKVCLTLNPCFGMGIHTLLHEQLH